MSRLGEGSLRLSSYHVGKVWVRDLAAEAAFRPRLVLSAGCQLQEVAASPGRSDGVSGFKIAALGGQLRWASADGPVVGDLSVPRGLEHAPPAPHSVEYGFTMSCDVPHDVLSRLEAERGGARPTFWMDLAGSWAVDGRLEPIYQKPWCVDVPTDIWLAFLSASGYDDVDVIELRRVLKDGGSLQPAIEYLTAARRLVSSDPSKAVGICRLVIEATDKALKDQGHGKIAEHLVACTDERRGKEYGSIASSLKQLAGLDHHHFGQTSTFTRPEALATVRICEAVLLLVAELAPSPADEQSPES